MRVLGLKVYLWTPVVLVITMCMYFLGVFNFKWNLYWKTAAQQLTAILYQMNPSLYYSMFICTCSIVSMYIPVKWLLVEMVVFLPFYCKLFFLQIQFVSLIVHYGLTVKMAECPPSKGVALFIICNTTFFLVLFFNFYRQCYVKKELTNSDGVNGLANSASVVNETQLKKHSWA